jgi:hypothetical protein
MQPETIRALQEFVVTVYATLAQFANSGVDMGPLATDAAALKDLLENELSGAPVSASVGWPSVKPAPEIQAHQWSK